MPDNDPGQADAPPLLRFVHREMVLVSTLIVVAAVGFVATKAAADGVETLRLRDAAAWHARGVEALQGGRTAEAIAALRRAATLAPLDDRFQLALAQSLATNGERGQARLVLLRLREHHPEDPDVDLALARLEAQGGDPATAIRYYQHALAALWHDSQNAIRPRVRLELIELLLRHGQRSRALSELLVVGPTVRDDAATRTRLGQMFLQAGDAARAAQEYAAALRLEPANGAALAGAGEAAFQQGQYARARQLLARAPASIGRVDDLRAITDFVLTRDPLASRLSQAERRRRLGANLDHVSSRASECAATANLGALQAEVDAMRARLARRRAIAHDAAGDAMVLVSRLQQAVVDGCGPTSPLDHALVLIARRHELRMQ